MKGVSRRQFLAVTALAGGSVLFALSPIGRRFARRFAAVDPSLYVAIHPDDTIVVTIPKSEMGQGVRTSLAMLVAEEMDADWSKVRVETAPLAQKFGYQGTSGSASVTERFMPLRRVGAAARAMLVDAASRELNAPASELRAERSVVRHGASGRSISYGALAAHLAGAKPPRFVSLKARADWRLLGTKRPGIDVPNIVRGTAVYGIDVRVPGMHFASVERPREFSAAVKSFDASAALAVPGVLKIVETRGDPRVELAPGVAVVATNTWAALEGRRALKVEWTSGPHASESSESYSAVMRDAVTRPGSETVTRTGDPDGVLAKEANVIRADYEVPFLAHATMEPMNCTASAHGGSVELWAPTQIPDIAASATARALGVPVANVTVRIPLIGGGFGRRINADYAVEAALLSKQIGAPVQVVWTREDDVRHDFYRPCASHRLEAASDATGRLVAWRHRLCSAAIAASSGRRGSDTIGAGESQGASNPFYRAGSRSFEYTLLRSGVPRGWWRSVHSTHTVFAVESFIDELALAARRDPIEYRLALIETPNAVSASSFDPERLEAVLALAADKAAWSRPVPGRAQGVACAFERMSYAAEIVELVQDDGAWRVHRVVVAVDCGPVVNLSAARAQIEGGVMQALSAALKERITIAGGRVVQGNFDDYPVLRINEAPVAIDVHFVIRDGVQPTGLGELPVPPLAPALANAIARATGKRLRSLPLVIPSEGKAQ